LAAPGAAGPGAFPWATSARSIAGARCLDLFAGSGALGLEALSRGAAQAVFVEKAAAAARELRQTLALWGGAPPATAQIHVADAIAYLAGKPEVFDLVFLDPPFAAGLLAQIIARLEAGHWLAANALVYAECPAREALPALPAGWTVAKTGRAGEVGYHLLRRTPL
jgi:16S rRNA (guanine966-N2)-methyltransferase